MARLSQRTDKFRNDIRDGKIGCPAAQFLFDPGAGYDPKQSIVTVGVTGSFDNQCEQVAEAFAHLWQNEEARVLALFPAEEPQDLAQSSECFRSIFFALSQGSHRIFRSEVDSNLALNLSSNERDHWEQLNGIRFETEQLEYLRVHHGDQVWKYVSNNTLLMMDLIAPFPELDPSWNSNISVIFTLSPGYPEYPGHLRHSEVSAMVLNKYQDLIRLHESEAATQAVKKWADKSETKYMRGIHTDHPPLSREQALLLQEKYLNLRQRLASERLVRPIVLTVTEQLMMLSQTVRLSKELMLPLYKKFSPRQLIPILEHCRVNNIAGDEAIAHIIQQVEQQKTD